MENTLQENQPATATCTVEERRTVRPRFNAAESEHAFIVRAEVPGVAQADIETTLHGDDLIIHARRTSQVPEGWKALHRESADADYRLALKIDHRVDREKIGAQLANGILTLTLPKAESLKPRQIEIRG
jgi:HSP20 family protein